MISEPTNRPTSNATAGDSGEFTYRQGGAEAPLPLPEDRSRWFPLLTFLGTIAFVLVLGGWWYAASQVTRMDQSEFVQWSAGERGR